MKRLNQLISYFFFFTVPISPSISVKLLLVSMLLSFFTYRAEMSFSFFSKRTWDIIFYFFVIGFGIFYSENWKNGFSVLETSFSLIGVCFIFLQFEANEVDLKKVVYAFIFGVLIACVICLGNAGLGYVNSGDIQVFSYYQLTNVIDSHPTYLAYYLIASITYGMYLIFYKIEEVSNIIMIPLIIFFFIVLMLTGGRTAYISLLLVLAFFILKFLIDDIRFRKTNAFILIVFLLVGLLGLSSLDYFNNEINVSNDYWERSQLWHSAINANPSPFFGVGTGDYKMVLNDYYLSHNLEEFAKGSYNSHNQFIQLYFTNGIVGLLILVIMIARPLYLSVKSQNALGILLMFPFIIYGVTEVFLGRYQGVVFFAILHQMVIYQHYSNTSAFALKQQ